VGRIAAEDLGDLAQPSSLEVSRQTGKRWAGVPVRAPRASGDVDVGTDEPRPRGPLAVGAVSAGFVAVEGSNVRRVGRREAAHAERGEQLSLDRAQERLPAGSIEHRIGEAGTEELVGTQREVVA